MKINFPKFSPAKTKFIILIVLILVIIILITVIVIPILNKLGVNILKEYLGYNYWKDPFGVYIRKSEGGWCVVCPTTYYFEKIEGADPSSIKILDEYYLQDKNSIFCSNYITSRKLNISPDRFKLIGNGFYEDGVNIWKSLCAKIKKAETSNSPSENFDIDSFQLLKCGIAKDKTGIFYYPGYPTYYMPEGEIFLKANFADPDTFQLDRISNNICFFKDKNFSYQRASESKGLIIIESGNAMSDAYKELGCGFKLIDGKVYWQSKLVEGADAASFEPYINKKENYCRSGTYASDNKNVFYEDKLLAQADLSTFTVIDTVGDYGAAFDKYHRYYYGENIEFSPGKAEAYARAYKTLQYQKEIFPDVIITSDRIEVDLGACKPNPEIGSGGTGIKEAWSIGPKSITVKGKEDNYCLLEFRTEYMIFYDCRIPDEGKLILGYDEEFGSLNLSLDPYKYCESLVIRH